MHGVEAASGWHGPVRARPGTPAEIVNKLNAALQPILTSDGDEGARHRAGRLQPASSTPDELAKRLADDLVRLQPIVKAHRRPPRSSSILWTARFLRAHTRI